MKFWADKLKPISGASPMVGYLNLFFVLLLVFVVSSQFVTIAGIRSKSLSLLPAMKSADIKLANKIIVSVMKKEVEVAGVGAAPAVAGKASAPIKVVSYEYSLNGKVVQDAEALREALCKMVDEVQLRNSHVTNELMIVLMASKDIPYEKLIDFYKLCRGFRVPLYLAVNDGTMEQMPSQLHGGLE